MTIDAVSWGLLFYCCTLKPETAYHVREIARLTHTFSDTLHKGLNKLANAGILIRTRRGNQLTYQAIYQANRACPVFEELSGIMRKTSGLADVLVQALAAGKADIAVAFLFGLVARAQETAGSDVNVRVMGALSFAEVAKQLYPVQTRLGREE